MFVSRSFSRRPVLLAAAATLCLAAWATPSVAAQVESDMQAVFADASPAGEVAADTQVTVVLMLRLRDEAGLHAFIGHAYDKRDPQYRRFLTPAAFADSFGATAEDYAAVTGWATSQGLSLGEASVGRSMVVAKGTAAQVEAALGVRLHAMRTKQGRSFYAADAAPDLPAPIATRVASVLGLSSYNHFAPLARMRPPGAAPDTAGGSGPNGAYSALDLRRAYAVSRQTPAAATETIAIYEEGGYDPADVTQYQKTNNLPVVPVTPRLVNGYGGGINDPNVELEAVLDIDMVSGLNPAAKSLMVYEDGDDSFGVSLLACLNAMANDDTAQTVSISYGLDEKQQHRAQIMAEGQVFAQLAAQGMAVFVSSGDDGAYGRSGNGLNAPDPGSQPYVTSVGGTSLFTGPKSTYYVEEAWNQLSSFYGATGGGVSDFWKLPSYQKEKSDGSVAVANGGSAKMRNVPDVAADAGIFTGVAVYSALNGGWVQVGGTSVSAPIWAGYFSTIDAANKGLGLGQLGFFNPALYATARQVEGFDLHDVVDGSNGNAAVFGIPGYNAGYGYDNTTGWGSPVGGSFLIDFLLDNLAFGKGAKPPAPKGLSASATASKISVDWTPSAGATGYFVLAFNESSFTAPTLYEVVGGNHHSATLTTATPASTYFVEVFAVDMTGAASNSLYVTTASK